jgi:hypothetical protein
MHTANEGLMRIQYKCLIWNLILYVGHLCELSAQPLGGGEGRGQPTALCLAAVPCPSLRFCG